MLESGDMGGESGITLTAGQVAVELQYFHRDGRPRRDLIYRMVREGQFPPPIDPKLSITRWRWSRRQIESYVEGVGE